MIPKHNTFAAPRIALLAIAVFCVLYNVAFIGYESLSLGRLSVVFLFCWAIYEHRNPVWVLRTRAWILFLPVAAVAMQFFFVPDFGQLSRFVYLAYFSFFGAACFSAITRDMGLALRVVLIAISAQAIFLFISFFSPAYRDWFDSAVLSGSNYGATYLYRAPGFSSEGGSSMSVIQSFGVLAGWLLLRQNEVYSRVSGKGVYFVFLGMILSALSCIVVGRTGLLLSCVFFGLFFISVGIRPRLALFLVAIAISVYFVISFFLTSLLSNDFSVDYFVGWAFGFFTGEDDTARVLAAMPIPPLTADTFFGTGLANIVDGRNPSGHDSGFIQAYFSMGLFMAALLYSIYLYVLFYILSWLPTIYRVVLALLVFALEIKEPFLFKYSTMFVLMSLHFCQKYALKRLAVSRVAG